MDNIQRLIDFEEIKQLKARYWRGVDTKDHALLRSVFADDAEIDFREDAPPGDEDSLTLPHPDFFVRHALAMLEGVVTAHQGHVPEITFTSATEASAIWPMEDNLWVDQSVSVLPFATLRGFGHYHDRYVKTADGWKIAATRLNRSKVITS